MIRFTGLNTYKKKTEAQKALIKSKATDLVRRRTREVLRFLVLNTPQFSGNTAASWRIDLNYKEANRSVSALYDGSLDEIFAEGGYKEPKEGLRLIGDEGAWKEALRMNEAHFRAIRWNANVSIVNVSSVADGLESGDIAEETLRPGNYIPGDVMAVKTAALKFNLMPNSIG